MRFSIVSTSLALIVFGSSVFAAEPDSFTEMAATDSWVVETAIKLAPAPQTNRVTKAVSAFFTDEATFDAAAPGLIEEDFSSASVGPGGVVGCGSPVINGNPCFAPDGIADGLAISASSGPNVVALGAGILGNTTPMVAADLFAASTILEFTVDDVFAVGLTFGVSGPPQDLQIEIEAFDGTPLEVTSTPVSATLSFWGVIATVPVGKITLTSPTGSGEVVDDIKFGVPGCNATVYDFEEGLIAPEWTLAGIGNANQESVEVVDDDGNLELALTADGATAYFGKDNAGFLYQELTGDFRIETDLDTSTMTTGKVWRKSGLMVRASLDHLDIRLLTMHAPAQGVLQFVAREVYGGPGNIKVALEEASPGQVRLAIERVDQTLTVQYSLDQGATWITPSTGLGGSIEIDALPETLQVGLAMVSNNISVTSTALFDDVSICQAQ